MNIGLIRAWDPSELGPDECGFCEQTYVAGSVVAFAFHTGGQRLCPSCTEYFGKRDPEKFVTIEQYREALERFPEPVYGSVEELERLDPWMIYDNRLV